MSAAPVAQGLLALSSLLLRFNTVWVYPPWDRALRNPRPPVERPPARAAGAGADHLLSEVDCRGHAAEAY